MENIENELKKLKVDAIIGKKKHFNAADRKDKYNTIFAIAIIVLDVLSGSIFVYEISKKDNIIFEFIPLLLILASAILTGVQRFMKFHEDSIGHRKIGNQYIEITRDINMLLAFLNDNAITHMKFQQQTIDIKNRLQIVNKSAEKYITNKKDFEKAKTGITEGEENYTDEELQVL